MRWVTFVLVLSWSLPGWNLFQQTIPQHGDYVQYIKYWRHKCVWTTSLRLLSIDNTISLIQIWIFKERGQTKMSLKKRHWFFPLLQYCILHHTLHFLLWTCLNYVQQSLQNKFYDILTHPCHFLENVLHGWMYDYCVYIVEVFQLLPPSEASGQTSQQTPT